jgi:zinc transport system substrate-binding protein
MKHAVRILLCFGCFIQFSGLISVVAQTPSPLRVGVAIEPQAFLVERIGGDRVQVQTLIQANQDPHTFQISPRQVQSLAQANLLFTSRTPFEERLTEKIAQTYPNLRIEDMAAGIQRKWSDEHEEERAEGAKQEIASPPLSPTPAASATSTTLTATDPHIWLSPRFLRIQAETIARKLAELDSPQADFYKQNLQTFLKDLDALDQRIARQLAPYKGRAFYVYHPAFGCFASDYGLVQKSVEIEGKAPTAKQLSQLVEQARADRVRVLFSEEQFNPRSPGILAEAIGAQVKPLNPLARDVLKNLDTIAQNLAEAFREETP